MSDKMSRWFPRSRRAVRNLLVAGVAAAAAAAAVATLSSTANGSASVAIPSPAASKLAAIMLQVAATSGDAQPESITAVTTTHTQALEAATPGDTIPGSDSETVYLAVMKGNFTLSSASVPPGGHAPAGHYLAMTFDPATFSVLDVGLSDDPPAVSLSSLGPVSDLTQRP